MPIKVSNIEYDNQNGSILRNIFSIFTKPKIPTKIPKIFNKSLLPIFNPFSITKCLYCNLFHFYVTLFYDNYVQFSVLQKVSFSKQFSYPFNPRTVSLLHYLLLNFYGPWNYLSLNPFQGSIKSTKLSLKQIILFIDDKIIKGSSECISL